MPAHALLLYKFDRVISMFCGLLTGPHKLLRKKVCLSALGNTKYNQEKKITPHRLCRFFFALAVIPRMNFWTSTHFHTISAIGPIAEIPSPLEAPLTQCHLRLQERSPALSLATNSSSCRSLKILACQYQLSLHNGTFPGSAETQNN